jgi:hypothetical protein
MRKVKEGEMTKEQLASDVHPTSKARLSMKQVRRIVGRLGKSTDAPKAC